jgi:DNA primase
MKNFSDELIEEIKLNNDILDVVSDYVKLTRKGKDYFGLCPFHQEKTASFSVVPGKGIYYCFGCHSGGSVIQFIMNIENLNYIEALEHLAKKAGISIPQELDAKYSETNRKKEILLGINKIAAHYYFDRLKTNKEAMGYLSARKIKSEAITRFGLGYADDRRDGIFELLKKEGFGIEEINESGLVTRNDNGSYTDKFRNRIIFPIFDVYGNVLAFGGRVLDSSQPKYLNSPETVVYKKGKHLYGLNFAKKTQRDFFIIVEGYVDVVVMYQEGYDCVTASLGTALTTDQARLINRYNKKIILAYDSDDAGKAASLRALDIFSKLGAEPAIIVLPDSKDPDEYIKKHGTRKFQELVSSSKTPVEFKVDLIKDKYSSDTTQDKTELFRELIKVLSEIDDMTQVDMYAAKYSKELHITKDAIINDVNRRKGGSEDKSFISVKKEKDSVDLEKRNEYELLILLLYFNHKTSKDKIEEYFSASNDTDPVIRRVYELIFSSSRDIMFADILEQLDGKYISSVIKMNEKVENIDNKEKAFNDFVIQLLKIKLEAIRKRIRENGNILSKENKEIMVECEECRKKIEKLKEE